MLAFGKTLPFESYQFAPPLIIYSFIHLFIYSFIYFRFVYPGLVIALVMYLAFGVVQELKQLQSLSGVVVFISITYFTSKHPDRVGYSFSYLYLYLSIRLTIYINTKDGTWQTVATSTP